MDRLGLRNVPRQAWYFDAHLEQSHPVIADRSLCRLLEWENPVYLAAMLDLFSRWVVRWAMAATADEPFVERAFHIHAEARQAVFEFVE